VRLFLMCFKRTCARCASSSIASVVRALKIETTGARGNYVEFRDVNEEDTRAHEMRGLPAVAR